MVHSGMHCPSSAARARCLIPTCRGESVVFHVLYWRPVTYQESNARRWAVSYPRSNKLVEKRSCWWGVGRCHFRKTSAQMTGVVFTRPFVRSALQRISEDVCTALPMPAWEPIVGQGACGRIHGRVFPRSVVALARSGGRNGLSSRVRYILWRSGCTVRGTSAKPSHYQQHH